MKTKFLIIIGIVIGIVIILPAMLSNHLQIVLNEIAPVISEDYEIPPKIDDKYYIEPTRKAQLEAVEFDLRNKILQFSQKNPLGSFSVNLDHITKEIVVITENEQFNSEIEEMISQYPEDVPIVFSNGKFEIIDFSEPAPDVVFGNMKKLLAFLPKK